MNMDNLADIFQVERVLERKISSSGIDEMIEVVVPENYGKIQMSLMVNKLYKKMRGKIQLWLVG